MAGLFALAALIAVAADDPSRSLSPAQRPPAVLSETNSITFLQAADSALPPTGAILSAVGNSGTNIPSGLPGRNMNSLDDKQKLAVGDTISFRVVEDQDEAKALTVTDAGELDVPELGLVAAAGKTCRQLAFDIKAKLEQVTYYQATVIVGIGLLNKTMSGRRVYVAGQVRQPGPQEIPAGETWTVTKAIMRAGGFTDYADKKRVHLIRAQPNSTPGKTVTVNVAEILEKSHTELDLSVEPEDLIYVPARAVNF